MEHSVQSGTATHNNQSMLRFDGATYDPKLDHDRRASQLDRIRELMLDGQWRTLREIAQAVNGSEAGVSARLRDLRKARFGAFTVEHRRLEGGLWEYRVAGERA